MTEKISYIIWECKLYLTHITQSYRYLHVKYYQYQGICDKVLKKTIILKKYYYIIFSYNIDIFNYIKNFMTICNKIYWN